MVNPNYYRRPTFLQKSAVKDHLKYISRYQLRFCDALRDLVPFVQFKKRVKHQWRSLTFAGFSLRLY